MQLSHSRAEPEVVGGWENATKKCKGIALGIALGIAEGMALGIAVGYFSLEILKGLEYYSTPFTSILQ